MEDSIVLNGEWFIPETNESFSGELHINTSKKQIWMILTAITTEQNPRASINVKGRTDIIKGKISSGGTILLYDCDIGGQHIHNFSKTTVSITAKAAFCALDLDKRKDICFNEIRVDFGEVIDWTGLCYFDWDYENDFRNDKLQWKYKDEVEFQISDNLMLKIAPQLGSKSSRVTTKEMKITQTVYFYLKYKEKMQWDIILNDIKVLNDLLTLGMNKAIFIDEVSYYHDSHKYEYRPEIIREATVYLGNHRDGKHNAGHWHEYLFNLEDLTNNNCSSLEKWYYNYDKLRPVIDLYSSAFNYTGISAEMLFLNLIQALETYHARFISDNFKEYCDIINEFLRKSYNLTPNEEFKDLPQSYRELLIAQNIQKSKSITLKSRLGDLFLARFEIIFSFLNYNITEFIQTTLDSRNYFTHYSVNKEDKIFPKTQLPFVNGILLAILQYYIMKEIGIYNEKIKERVNQQLGAVEHSYNMIK